MPVQTHTVCWELFIDLLRDTLDLRRPAASSSRDHHGLMTRHLRLTPSPLLHPCPRGLKHPTRLTEHGGSSLEWSHLTPHTQALRSNGGDDDSDLAPGSGLGALGQITEAPVRMVGEKFCMALMIHLSLQLLHAPVMAE